MPTPHISVARRRVLRAAVAMLAFMAIGCGSSGGSSGTDAASGSTSTPSSSASGSSATTGGSSGSNGSLPDACTLLTKADLDTVLKGADNGQRQLTACVWTDAEGTAARLVVSQPKTGATLDSSGGAKALDGVGDKAVVATAPGTVRVAAQAKGYQIDFSVDTGTQDIKPNQENAIALVKKAIANLP